MRLISFGIVSFATYLVIFQLLPLAAKDAVTPAQALCAPQSRTARITSSRSTRSLLMPAALNNHQTSAKCVKWPMPC